MSRPSTKRHSNCEPAFSIVRRLGGEEEVAAACHTSLVTVYRWMTPKGVDPETGRHRDGCGGFIPRRHWLALTAFAASKGIMLTEADFVSKPLPKGLPAHFTDVGVVAA